MYIADLIVYSGKLDIQEAICIAGRSRFSEKSGLRLHVPGKLTILRYSGVRGTGFRGAQIKSYMVQ